MQEPVTTGLAIIYSCHASGPHAANLTQDNNHDYSTAAERDESLKKKAAGRHEQ
jgi:hypothetical protein